MTSQTANLAASREPEHVDEEADDGADLFATFLSPALNVDTFFDSVWHQKPFHISRSDQSFYDPYFSIEHAEEMWFNAMRSPEPNALLYFSEGQQRDLKTPFFAFAHHCSVVVNKADRYCGAIHDICEHLSRHFPYVYCNVYTTPPASQTVPAHSDDRDVLVLQVHGDKHWTVYGAPPVELPYKEEEVGKNGNPVDLKALPVVFDGVLRQGDAFYLPRGFVHQAKALEQQPSMHLTVAIQSSDWDMGSLLRGGLQELLRSQACAKTARQGVSRQVLAGNGPCKKDFENFSAALEEMLDKISVKDCVANFQDRMATLVEDRDEFIAGHFRPISNPLSMSSMIIWNRTVTFLGADRLTSEPGSTYIRTVDSVAHFERQENTSSNKSSATPSAEKGGGGTMSISVSRIVLGTMAMMFKEYGADVPCLVKDLPVGSRDPLLKLSVGNLLIRLGLCVRVS